MTQRFSLRLFFVRRILLALLLIWPSANSAASFLSTIIHTHAYLSRRQEFQRRTQWKKCGIDPNENDLSLTLKDETLDNALDHDRRSFFRRSVGVVAVMASLQPTIQNVQAVEERNEALCKTGFFTNIAQWYCTEIGNIGDEAKAKNLTSTESSSINDLMGKLSLD